MNIKGVLGIGVLGLALGVGAAVTPATAQSLDEVLA